MPLIPILITINDVKGSYCLTLEELYFFTNGWAQQYRHFVQQFYGSVGTECVRSPTYYVRRLAAGFGTRGIASPPAVCDNLN